MALSNSDIFLALLLNIYKRKILSNLKLYGLSKVCQQHKEQVAFKI